MLDTISALKTNNARKIPNYDPSLLEHMKRLLRGILRTTGELLTLEGFSAFELNPNGSLCVCYSSFVCTMTQHDIDRFFGRRSIENISSRSTEH